MREESLAELLRSPLDDDREPHPLPPWVRPFLLTLVSGALATLALLASTGGGTVIVTASTTSAPVTTIDVVPFPPGYTPIDDRVALSPVAMYVDGDDVVVVVTAVSAAGSEPTETLAFPGGVWELRDVEGRVYEQSTEVRNPQALATTAVRFVGAATALPRTVALIPFTQPEVLSTSVPVDLPDFPLATGTSFEVALASDLRLFAILVRLDEESGEIDWALRGAEGLAQVDVTVVLPETADDAGAVTAMLSEHIAPPYPFQRQRLPRPVPRETNRDVLRRTGPEIADPDGITRAVVEVTVYLYRTQKDATVELDLGDLAGG